MSASFTSKIIRVVFTLSNGTFAGSSSNTVTLEGLRVRCKIEKNGNPSKNGAKLQIYGMSESLMNQLTALAFKPLAVRNNLVQVFAGDVNGMTQVFSGTITMANAVYRSPPNLYFNVEAITGYFQAVAPASPTSVKGGASVAVLMQSLAGKMGYSFQNNGVTTQVSNPYLPGTCMQQAQSLANSAGCEFIVDDDTLVIAPRGVARSGTAPLISATTGMKEYPVFDKKGIKVECLYNSAVLLGGLIVVQSVVKAATGTWRVNGLTHELESEKPGGKWDSVIKASYVGN